MRLRIPYLKFELSPPGGELLMEKDLKQDGTILWGF